jgi:hypothetical protein
MSDTMRYAALLAVLTVILPFNSPASDNAQTGSGKFCTQTRFGACRVVHGRYGIYVENNGIFDIRSKKLLTTAGDGELDKMIYAAGSSFDHEVLGDFTVCPISKTYDPTESRTKASQAVCVQSFTKTRVAKRK